jgi:hypothetical protein
MIYTGGRARKCEVDFFTFRKYELRRTHTLKRKTGLLGREDNTLGGLCY